VKIIKKKSLTNGKWSYIIPTISCEAEITDEYDLLESRGAGESPAGNDRSNGPPSAQGKRVSCDGSWPLHHGECVGISTKSPIFTNRETRWHRESIVLVST